MLIKKNIYVEVNPEEEDSTILKRMVDMSIEEGCQVCAKIHDIKVRIHAERKDETSEEVLDIEHKTIMFFNDFPEPYRTQALENFDTAASTRVPETASDALLHGFIWADSPQKANYWREFNKSIQ